MFKRIRFFIPIIFCLVIISCASETSKEASVDGNSANEQIKVSDKDPGEKIRSDNNQVAIERKELSEDIASKPPEVKKVIKEAEKLAEENIAKSENKGKSCDEIIKELDALIVEIIKDKTNKELMTQLAKWNTDVLHNNCRKDPAYEASFLEIISKLN